jgi:DNA-binding CsgD family transcriptional regulator
MISQQQVAEKPPELQLRVLARVIAGESYREIAMAEFMSSRTVRRLVGSLKQQTGAENLAALAAEATRRGWLTG